MSKSKASTQIAVREEPSVALMLQAVIEKGVTADNVKVLEAMCGLYERMEAKKAEKEFNSAFAALQAQMPNVEAIKGVPDKHGVIKYRYAPYEEIMKKVQPFLTEHGFAITFTTKSIPGTPEEPERITAFCKLRHISGHSEVNEFSVRIGAGPPNATTAQADRSASSYAKRGALSDCLNIVVDHDDDARMIGKPISKAEADDLEARVINVGANREAFLKYAGAANFESISDDRYEMLDDMLKKKEAAAARSASTEVRDPQTGEFPI